MRRFARHATIAMATALLIGSAGLGAAAAPAAPVIAGGVALVVTMKPKAGRASELETVLADFIPQVYANSAGVMHFQLMRTPDPGVYKLVEIFETEAALAAHRASPHTAAFRPKLAEVLEEATVVEQFTAIE